MVNMWLNACEEPPIYKYSVECSDHIYGYCPLMIENSSCNALYVMTRSCSRRMFWNSELIEGKKKKILGWDRVDWGSPSSSL